MNVCNSDLEVLYATYANLRSIHLTKVKLRRRVSDTSYHEINVIKVDVLGSRVVREINSSLYIRASMIPHGSYISARQEGGSQGCGINTIS